MQMAKKHMRRCSTSLLEKSESKLKWGMISHQWEWPSLKYPQTVNFGEGVEKREPSCTVGRDVNWYSHHGE